MPFYVCSKRLIILTCIHKITARIDATHVRLNEQSQQSDAALMAQRLNTSIIRTNVAEKFIALRPRKRQRDMKLVRASLTVARRNYREKFVELTVEMLCVINLIFIAFVASIKVKRIGHPSKRINAISRWNENFIDVVKQWRLEVLIDFNSLQGSPDVTWTHLISNNWSLTETALG